MGLGHNPKAFGTQHEVVLWMKLYFGMIISREVTQQQDMITSWPQHVAIGQWKESGVVPSTCIAVIWS